MMPNEKVGKTHQVLQNMHSPDFKRHFFFFVISRRKRYPLSVGKVAGRGNFSTSGRYFADVRAQFMGDIGPVHVDWIYPVHANGGEVTRARAAFIFGHNFFFILVTLPLS